jgi:predicted TIM-barrel fold metal-dependent hydrolase
MLDEWCASYPDRFIPQTLVPLWDVPASVAEIERCAAKGSRAILFVENPHPLGLPSFPSGHWRPIFEACNATGLPLSMHIGTSAGLLSPSPDSTPSVGIALCGVNSMSALGDLIYGGVFNGLPNCRVALSEGGAGWVPYVLERLDYTWLRSRYAGLKNTELPSEVFAQHVWVCMISDRYAIRNRDLIGVDKIMWEADFPHNDSNWPNSRKVLAETMADVPDDEARRIAEFNARELYAFPRS